MGKQTFIEINGKKYDAITGRQLVESTSHHTAKTTKISPNQGVMDGFIRRPSQNKKASRVAPQHAVKNVQKSQTLMRKSVKKPEAVVHKTTPKAPGITKSSLGQQQSRVMSAQATRQSSHIKKFSQSSAPRTSIAKTYSQLSVQQPKTSLEQLPQKHTSGSQALVQHSPHKKAAEKIIESALNNAQSHTQTHQSTHKKKSRILKKLGISTKTMAMSSAVLAGVLLAGFFAVQNVPNFAMKVAATRAGFDASLPSYKPSGFSFKGPINYSAGKVTVSFASNTDNRSYAVTQQSSNWNSDALLSNFIEEEDKQYQTYVDRGRTLYIYDGSNATWVDNGIWYQVEGKSNMTTDQLVRIASSI